MKPTIITTMIGMNAFSERDADHPFDMSVQKSYSTIWLPQVDKEEKKNTCLYYEVPMAVEAARKEVNVPTGEIVFIFGRGTMGHGSEEALHEAIVETERHFGQDCLHIMVGKSFGVVDTLRALYSLKKSHRRPPIDLMLLIDGYAPVTSTREISKRVCLKRYLKIPGNVKKCCDAVQRKEGMKGLKAVLRDGVTNFTVRPEYVDSHQKYYDHYSDGYRRRLDVKHFNMEEIASVIPVFESDGAMMNLHDIIKKTCIENWK